MRGLVPSQRAGGSIPLPLPLLRNGPLPLPLSREPEVPAVASGALADLLVVDGNPLKKLSLLEGQGAHLKAIMKGGQFFKNELG